LDGIGFELKWRDKSASFLPRELQGEIATN
jgi:hypothetical protein